MYLYLFTIISKYQHFMFELSRQTNTNKGQIGMTLLHAHAHYICRVCAKYQKASLKALVQVDFLMYAISKNKHNPYLVGNRKNG